ncbi:MAG TPA: BON domain-containing protein [Phycisphaerae bacterium]|nr:BON domain-containing protein [Phycisphaerae bacterium]
MRVPRIIPGAILLAALALGGCAAPTHKTLDPGLLDNDVLQQRVNAALQRGGADFSGVHAQASEGTVDLTGVVAFPAARAWAENTARKVYGVKAVKNDVQVGDARKAGGG